MEKGGSVFKTYTYNNTLTVLILVLMEKGGSISGFGLHDSTRVVLILVLMEKGGLHNCCMNPKIFQKCLNPCSDGKRRIMTEFLVILAWIGS